MVDDSLRWRMTATFALFKSLYFWTVSDILYHYSKPVGFSSFLGSVQKVKIIKLYTNSFNNVRSKYL